MNFYYDRLFVLSDKVVSLMVEDHPEYENISRILVNQLIACARLTLLDELQSDRVDKIHEQIKIVFPEDSF